MSCNCFDGRGRYVESSKKRVEGNGTKVQFAKSIVRCRRNECKSITYICILYRLAATKKAHSKLRVSDNNEGLLHHKRTSVGESEEDVETREMSHSMLSHKVAFSCKFCVNRPFRVKKGVHGAHLTPDACAARAKATWNQSCPGATVYSRLSGPSRRRVAAKGDAARSPTLSGYCRMRSS